MSLILLIISIASLSWLSFYAVAFLYISLSAPFLNRKKRNKTPEHQSGESEPATVLIPARNEGKAVLDAIAAVKRQDYGAYIRICLIFKDESDSSLPFIEKDYGHDKAIEVIFAGRDAKKDKLNFVIPKVKDGYIAILDADHRPSANWISSSIRLIQETGASAVQSRRAPLDISSLPQIWDSSQNHGGNELLNIALSASGKSVFFTGTAAVFKTDVLRANLFGDSITEDTDLSYTLLLKGDKIVYNNKAVSYEEVAPSLQSYVFRRRRWSSGHSQAYFKNIVKIFKSRLSFLEKIILFFHGRFYLSSIAVLAFNFVYGIHFFIQLSDNYRLAIALLSIFFSFWLSYAFRQKKRISLVDFIVSLLWIAPQLAALSVFVQMFLGLESYYYILSFPFAKEMAWWWLALFLSPLAPLISAAFIFKNSRRFRNLWLIPTYPITLFLDIYACLLGFSDLLLGRAHWSVIKRNNRYSANLVPEELSSGLSSQKRGRMKKSPYLFALIGLVLLFFINELLATDNCGQVEKFIYPPLLIKQDSGIDLDLQLRKEASLSGSLKIIIQSEMSGSNVLEMRAYVDGKKEKEILVPEGNGIVLEKEYPYGFDKHDIIFKLKKPGSLSGDICRRSISFTTVYKEIKGSDFFLNGEKYLVKGMIPSFFGGRNALSIDLGFKQIKEAGINTIRFYHGANSKMMEMAAKYGLMIIDQPDRSTWSDFDVRDKSEVNSFINRYKDLVASHDDDPYLLWTGLGNEWELSPNKPPSYFSGYVYRILGQASHLVLNFPSTYSTYFTFLDNPIDIASINMLDNGRVYWQKAIDVLSGSGKPFYASEFGGFVAFLEDTVPEIRYERMFREWESLLAHGGLGANFYESHDNWAQPLVYGYNDPLKPEKSDDKRGYWDADNKAKLELDALKKLVSDIEASSAASYIEDCSRTVEIKMENRRDYNLKGVVMQYGNETMDIGDFSPHEIKNVAVRADFFGSQGGVYDVLFSYTTHSGLINYSSWKLSLPCLGKKPIVMNDDFYSQENKGEAVSGRLITSSVFDVVIPEDWAKFRLNGKEYGKTSPRQKIDLGGPYRNGLNMEISRDNKTWSEFKDDDSVVEGGRYYIRFNWPENGGGKEYLIMGGMGSEEAIFYTNQGTKKITLHSYRENTVPASEIGSPHPGDLVTYSIERNDVNYIDYDVTKRTFDCPVIVKDDILVGLEMPKVFSVNEISLEKAE